MKRSLFVFALLIAAACACFGQAALDPSRLASGARNLGLGRAFVGLADDVNSIFMNPAGLAELPRWQLTSMSGQFAEEYNYLLLTGAYPTEVGTFGLGFVGATTGGVPVTKILPGTEADPIYVIDPSQPSINYYNNVFFLSYAKALAQILNFKLPWTIDLGGSLKIFQTSLSGNSIIDGVGTGTDMDFGLKLKPRPWLTLGAEARNALPESLGGKLTYANGYSESYPAAYFAGGSVSLLGPKENSLYQFMNQKLTLLLDSELNRNQPMLLHMAAEWTPLALISLRFGIDQDSSTDQAGNKTVENGLAYGVGLNYGGFRFDYAYHQFPGLPGITNNYFSLSYGFGEPPKGIPPVKLVLSKPDDKLITFESSVLAGGKIFDERIDSLYLNGARIRFDLRGSFEATIELKEGKNLVLIEGKNGKEPIVTQKLRILRLKIFPDVQGDYWVGQPISLLAMQNIITGYPDGSFRPEGNITRAEMCTLLMRTTEGRRQATGEASSVQRPSSKVFDDVSVKHWAAGYITEAAEKGIVKGYPDGSFRPGGNITRAEGLAMVARFARIGERAYADEFPDIATKHWAATIIAGAKQAGLLKYLEGKSFEPNKLLSRAETVELLQRTTTVMGVLAKDLLNWESY